MTQEQLRVSLLGELTSANYAFSMVTGAVTAQRRINQKKLNLHYKRQANATNVTRWDILQETARRFISAMDAGRVDTWCLHVQRRFKIKTIRMIFRVQSAQTVETTDI